MGESKRKRLHRKSLHLLITGIKDSVFWFECAKNLALVWQCGEVWIPSELGPIGSYLGLWDSLSPSEGTNAIRPGKF